MCVCCVSDSPAGLLGLGVTAARAPSIPLACSGEHMSWRLPLDSIPVLSGGFLHDGVCEGDPRGGSLWVASCMEETSSCADKAHAFLQASEFRRQKDRLEPVVEDCGDIWIMRQ